MDPLRSPSRSSVAESPSKQKLKEESPTLYTLNKLKTFFDDHAFDTEGPYADLFSVLLSTCRHLIDVNISQNLRSRKTEADLAALNGEMGALSVFAAEQIKEEDDRKQQQQRRGSARGSFLFQKPDSKAPSLTAAALREEAGEEARASPAPTAPREAGGARAEAEEDDGPSYTLHKTLYSVLKTKIAEQAASHQRLLEHVQWMTPQIARLEEQQLQILKQLEAVRETLHQTNVTVRRASSVANSPSAAAAAARRASVALRENEERQSAAAPTAALAQEIHALSDGLRTCEAELRVLRGAVQRGTRAGAAPAVHAAEEAERSVPGSEAPQAFVTREELAACLRERDRNINWALLDVQEEIERRGGDDGDGDNGDDLAQPLEEGEQGRRSGSAGARRPRGSVQIAAATGFTPSRLATDLSRKLQLILYTVAEKQIEKNVAYLLLRENEERYADVESRLEVLEVYSPHQRQVAVRPPLLGVELEDFTLTYNSTNKEGQPQHQQQEGAPEAVATEQLVRGVRIKKVYAGYPAAAAGLGADDVIVAVQGEEVRSRADLYGVLLELSQQYRCRCQLAMEHAFLKDTMLQVRGDGDEAAAAVDGEEQKERTERQLRGYRAFAPFLPAQAAAQEGEGEESVRAQQLREALPRFELPMTILRDGEFYSISVLIPSSMALNPSDE